MRSESRECVVLSPADISVGMGFRFQICFSDELISRFSEYSGDFNPLHNDADFARSRGYKTRVAHGAIQQALISRFVGMYIPGQNALIKKVTTTYSRPVLAGDEVVVDGKVVDWDGASLSGRLEIQAVSPHGAQFSFTVVDFGLTGVPQEAALKNLLQLDESRRGEHLAGAMMFIGGNSGLAKEVMGSGLLDSIPIVTVGRRECDFNLRALDQPELLEPVLESVQPAHLVSFLSLSPVKRSVLEMDFDHFVENVRLHLSPALVAARLIAAKRLTNMTSITLIGSLWASHLVGDRGHETYSYAKSLASFFVRDLAVELAPHKVRVNIVSPGEMSLGMNAGLSPKMSALLKARTPLGRLTTGRDVASVLSFLTSDLGSSVVGQELVLAGGRYR